MEIESVPGTGTTVRLYAPLSPAPVEEARLEKPAKQHLHARNGSDQPDNTSAIRLLLADDHDIVRQGIASLLTSAGDIVVIAQVDDGEKAIAAADALRPDVVVLDVNMPVRNGIRAAEVIRERVPAARIIGLSVHADPATRRAMLDAGAHAYLPKDGPAEDLLTAVRTLAAGAKTGGPAPVVVGGSPLSLAGEG
jgi:CheY-like chemotaxis protein